MEIDSIFDKWKTISLRNKFYNFSRYSQWLTPSVYIDSIPNCLIWSWFLLTFTNIIYYFTTSCIHFYFSFSQKSIVKTPTGLWRIQDGETNRMPGIIHTKTEVFTMTSAGGLYTSTSDPNVSVFVPARAIDGTLHASLKVGTCLIPITTSGLLAGGGGVLGKFSESLAQQTSTEEKLLVKNAFQKMKKHTFQIRDNISYCHALEIVSFVSNRLLESRAS